MKVDGRKIEISNTDKIFFEKDEITKGDVIDYYADVADYILPFLKDRPLMLQRFPDGIQGDGFYQKEASDYYPDWIETIEVEKEDGKVNHVICNDTSTLVYLANQGTLTFHAWLSRKDQLHQPDKLVIDLDPPSSDFEIVREAAFLIKEELDNMEVNSFIQTTGSSGLHVIIMLDRQADFDQSRSFGQDFGSYLSDKFDDIFTMAIRKEKRDGRLYFDVQRNAYAQTAVLPYSIRPIEGAPIATPLDWNELKDKSIESRTYHIKNIKKRLSQKDDFWKGIYSHTYNIESLNNKLAKLKN